MISGLFISFASLMGYVFSVHYWFRVPFRLSPLLCFGFLIISLFWAAVAKLLLPATIFLLAFGLFLSLVMALLRARGRTIVTDNAPRDSLIFFLGLAGLALACGLVGRPSVIDDYAYWAIISKSIQMFDGLPTSDTTIFARHLTYTPGLALFQYYFFTAFSEYNISAAYFAQNLLLVSLLFALTDQQDRTTSLIVWDNHCETLGFNQFHSGISLESLKAALNLPGSDDSRRGVCLFLKNLTIGGADRLKLPYLLWYFALGWLWYQTLKNYSSFERGRYFRLFCITLPIYLLYLGMNYVMQFVIFGLGTITEATTSLDRYVNIFFCWLILFTLTTVIVDRFTSGKPVTSRWPTVLIAVAVLLLAGSSLPKKQKKYELEITNLLQSTCKLGTG